GPLRAGSTDMLLSYRWSPDGDRLAIDTSDLIAKDRQIFVADMRRDAAPVARLLVHEQEPLNETFYFWKIEWSTDSKLLYFLSDRDEDYHVWAIAPSDETPELLQLTRGRWAVASMHPVEGGLVLVGNRGNAEERHLFRVGNRGGEPVRLSRRSGSHTPTISPDGRYAAVAFSSDDTPPELLLTALGSERSERQVTRSPTSEFSNYAWVVPEYVTFQSHVDGTTLHGRLTLPPNFDPDRTYPAILGSVYTDAVRNQWGGRTAHPTWGLDQYLAQEGYILLNVDMRGSWGRGRDHRRGIRLDYGGIDIEDLESGVRFLETLGYVEMDRVGIWGSSYGGLMTAMSLFRTPGLSAAGVAGAPATSIWHALTGQMAVMLGPKDSPDEYADSSPFMHAHGLEDPLMIIHGMRDRVVLFKDSVTLVQRLIMLGKDVDLVALPNSGHGWDNETLAQTRFAFNKLVEFFDRHLGETHQ
ncbi:MAG: prolyl oligopeptidase family serine peptidase, partial [Gemmatimonadota bacterium]|nr:prolyl oligopeptidase family serine peptidase [Gemmatimonadota bacterium]